MSRSPEQSEGDEAIFKKGLLRFARNDMHGSKAKLHFNRYFGCLINNLIALAIFVWYIFDK